MNELSVFEDYLKSVGLKVTRQREILLDEFLKIEDHVSAEEFFLILKKKYKSIGQATVFRTLKLLVSSGIAASIEFSDKTLRYEHRYNHIHHDHLICVNCGNIIEASDPEIEKLQEKLAKKHGLTPVSHSLQIFGICKACGRDKKEVYKKGGRVNER